MAGYIGSVVAAQQIDAGHAVVLFDNLSTNLSTGCDRAGPESAAGELAAVSLRYFNVAGSSAVERFGTVSNPNPP